MNLNKNFELHGQKRLIFAGLLLFVFNFFLIMAEDCNCDYLINLSQKNVDGESVGIQPGDTVCIEAGARSLLRLYNFHGDSLNPIVIKNCGGLVEIGNETNYGVNLSYCSFIHFTGTGDPSIPYGIKIRKTKSGSSGSNGLSLDKKSTDFEIDHIEITNTGFAGIMAKTEPTCDLLSNRGNFIQKNSSIHDNYIHNVIGEGIYLGSSYYTGQNKTCDNATVKLYPHELHGVRIYNNIIDSCGYDGIQVGSATQDCKVYNNQITNYGTMMIAAQHAGIQINAGTTGEFYNNLILNGSGGGMMVFGIGNVTIFNNVIVNAGYNYLVEDSVVRIHGIFIDDRATIAGAPFHIVNNTIISPRADGIRTYSDDSSGSRVWNNAIINPGSFNWYGTRTDRSFIYYNSDVDLDIRNNYFQEQLPGSVNFESVSDVYDYVSTLNLTGKGINVSEMGITFDYYHINRPDTGGVSIGAFELTGLPMSEALQTESISVERNILKIQKAKISKSEINIPVMEMRLFPNPCRGNFAVQSYGDVDFQKITVRSLNGIVVLQEIPSNKKFVNVGTMNGLIPGSYLVDIETNDDTLTKKLIVL